MSQKAELKLLPNRFLVSGPPILIMMIQAIVKDKATPEEMNERVNALYNTWHVICSVSGAEILLSELKYWDVPTQKVYAKPELIPKIT